MDLSLIIACYNEETVLEHSLKEIIMTLDSTTFTYEIIFVDDYSTDNTPKLINFLCEKYKDKHFRFVLHNKNIGRGGTVTEGFRMAKGDIIGYIDIDLEVHARYIPSCVLAIKDGADVAIGFRVYKFDFRSIDRYIMSKGYNWLMRKMLGINLKDTETGVKFFSRERILPILDKIKDQGWFWDTEIMVQSYLRKYTIAEIPCLFVRRFDNVSTVKGISDSIIYFKNLLRYRKVLENINRNT
ncbi:MAG: glycosyltransferase [Planctomycetota bacterium]